MAQELILKEKCKDMMKYGYQAIRDIPRDYRYTLGTDIRVFVRGGDASEKATTNPGGAAYAWL